MTIEEAKNVMEAVAREITKDNYIAFDEISLSGVCIRDENAPGSVELKAVRNFDGEVNHISVTREYIIRNNNVMSVYKKSEDFEEDDFNEGLYEALLSTTRAMRNISLDETIDIRKFN